MSTISRRKRKRLLRRAEATAAATGKDCRWDWRRSATAADVQLVATALHAGWPTPTERLANIVGDVLDAPGGRTTPTGQHAALSVVRGLIRGDRRAIDGAAAGPSHSETTAPISDPTAARRTPETEQPAPRSAIRASTRSL